MKKRRFSSRYSSDELPDVNEQELAKDGECPFRGNKNTGTDTPKCESVPVSSPEIQKTTAVVRSSVTEPIKSQKKNAEPPVPPKSSEEPSPSPEEEPEKNDVFEAPKPKRNFLGKIYGSVIVICMLISLALVFFAAKGISPEAPDTSDSQTQPPADTETVPDTPLPSSPTLSAGQIYEQGIKGTVSVINRRGGTDSFYNGFAVFDGGYIVTLHDAACGDSVHIVTHDQKMYDAEVVATDPTVNIALLKTDAPELSPLVTDSADKLTVGENVFAIGNLGSEQYASSLLVSQISHLDRRSSIVCPDGIQRRVSALQVSSFGAADVQGCPLFDSRGAVVALLFASEDGGKTSLAFNISDVMNVLLPMKEGIKPSDEVLCALAFTPPKLGILCEQAVKDGIWGVEIKEFSQSDTDASRQLRVNDLIYRIDDVFVTDTAGLSQVLESYTPSDTVKVSVLRSSQRLSFFVKLS